LAFPIFLFILSFFLAKKNNSIHIHLTAVIIIIIVLPYVIHFIIKPTKNPLLISSLDTHRVRLCRAVLQNHNNSSAIINQSSSNNDIIVETQHQVTATPQSRTSIINQTLQTININNNNNSNNKNKIHSNVDQQISSSRDRNRKEDEEVVADEEVLVEPNNNTNNHNLNNNASNTTTNNHHYSSSRACYRHHPVSRRGGTEFISQQVPNFRNLASGGSNNKYITQRKG
jgi:hypothetical protein